MTTVDGLIVLLAVVYLAECAAWIRRDAVPFRQGFLGRWRHTPPAEWGGHDRNALVFSGPLPPLPPLILTQPWPLSLSPEGVVLYSAATPPGGRRPPHPGRFLPWGDVRDVRIDGSAVRVRGEVVARFVSPLLADRVGGLLEEMARRRPGAREPLLREAIREALDAGAANERLAEVRKAGAGLTLSTNAFFVVLFGIAPFALHLPSFAHRWPIVLLWVVAFWGLVLFDFARARRGAGRRHFWMMLFSPLAALRARDVLWRDALVLFHPLAAAKALLREDAFRDFARQVLGDARFPRLPLGPFPCAEAERAEEWSRAFLLAETERFLREGGVDPEGLLAPPAREGASSLSYCERCRAQYTLASGSCVACGGRPLRSFD